MIEQIPITENYFLADVYALREAVNRCLERNITKEDDCPDVQTSIAFLQTVLVAEIVCVLRYTMISVSAAGLQNAVIGAEFQEQANDERKHMMMAAERIKQLGGKPNFEPDGLVSRTAAGGASDRNLAEAARENLIAENNIIELYRDLIGYFSSRDPVTCMMLKQILQDEENHTADMQDLMAAYGGHQGQYRN